jgi:hypothetical protein
MPCVEPNARTSEHYVLGTRVLLTATAQHAGHALERSTYARTYVQKMDAGCCGQAAGGEK